MRDIFFTEVRRLNQQIRDISNPEEKTSGTKMLVSVLIKMIELGNLARNEGLLALEDAIESLDEHPQNSWMRYLFRMVIDGSCASEVEEIGAFKYFAGCADGYDALAQLVILYGVLSIQSGENPRVLEDRMVSLLPTDIEEQYYADDKYPFTCNRKNGWREPFNQSKMESLYLGELGVDEESIYYFPIKITDYAICLLSDFEMQRVLKEVENADLSIAMKVLSGAARKKILTNMSSRLVEIIVEDMEFMGPVRFSDVNHCCEKIFSVIIKLIENGEISSQESEGLLMFHHIFMDAPDESVQ